MLLLSEQLLLNPLLLVLSVNKSLEYLFDDKHTRLDEMAKSGEKVGLVKVHLYRPFSAKYLLKVLPASAKKIAVLDRTKEPGSAGEPIP